MTQFSRHSFREKNFVFLSTLRVEPFQVLERSKKTLRRSKSILTSGLSQKTAHASSTSLHYRLHYICPADSTKLLLLCFFFTRYWTLRKQRRSIDPTHEWTSFFQGQLRSVAAWRGELPPKLILQSLRLGGPSRALKYHISRLIFDWYANRWKRHSISSRSGIVMLSSNYCRTHEGCAKSVFGMGCNAVERIDSGNVVGKVRVFWDGV